MCVYVFSNYTDGRKFDSFVRYTSAGNSNLSNPTRRPKMMELLDSGVCEQLMTRGMSPIQEQKLLCLIDQTI